MNRRWLCSDVWMDILPFFERVELGLKMALLSDRFDVLVDKHFEKKDEGPKPKMSIRIDDRNDFVDFPLSVRQLPNKFCFNNLHIRYIDHSVITFLRSKKRFFDRRGTNLNLNVYAFNANVQPIWDCFVREIWPAFVSNIHQLRFADAVHLNNLRRLISPTILTDLNHLNAINSGHLCPDVLLADNFDGPTNAISAGQALAKWLHTPTKDGQPKRLSCCETRTSENIELVNNFKEIFVRARTSAVSYTIDFICDESTQIVPFELVNERTKEKLTLKEKFVAFSLHWWIMERCPIIDKTAAVRQQKKKEADNLNNVYFELDAFQNCIGPLSPPPTNSKNGSEEQ